MKKTADTMPAFEVIFGREDDGRWIAEIPELPGVMTYGRTREEAKRRVSVIALRTLADSVEHGGRHAPVTRLFNYGLAGR